VRFKTHPPQDCRYLTTRSTRTDRQTEVRTATQHLNNALGYWQTRTEVLAEISVKNAGYFQSNCISTTRIQYELYTPEMGKYTPESHNVAQSSFPGELCEDLWWIKWNWKRIFRTASSFSCIILSQFHTQSIHVIINYSFIQNRLISYAVGGTQWRSG
jgi:hypothetical protein